MKSEETVTSESEIESAMRLYGENSLQVAACLEKNAETLLAVDQEAAMLMTERAARIRAQYEPVEDDLSDLIEATDGDALWRKNPVPVGLIYGFAATFAMVILSCLASIFGLASQQTEGGGNNASWGLVRISSSLAVLFACGTVWYWMIFVRGGSRPVNAEETTEEEIEYADLLLRPEKDEKDLQIDGANSSENA